MRMVFRWWAEFKGFALKGNVLELAVAVVLGALSHPPSCWVDSCCVNAAGSACSSSQKSAVGSTRPRTW
ncbi:MscL family protein [Tautonia sociabilis]|uniref:MscL family protein n=1 Tax=Tautonia sociabilis TaxID=2080755 RepID=UPI0018F66C40